VLAALALGTLAWGWVVPLIALAWMILAVALGPIVGQWIKLRGGPPSG